MTRILSNASITPVISLPVSFLLGESTLPHYWWVVEYFSWWHQGWKRDLWALAPVVGSCLSRKLLFLWWALVSIEAMN